MSDRLTRKEIKRDELAEAVEHAVDYAGAHLKMILLAVGGVILAALLGAGGWVWFQGREARASEALTHAMAIYTAPVGVASPKPDDPVSPSFADAAARSARAREAFEKLDGSYGGTGAGKVADLYLGHLALEDGDQEAAQAHWTKFVENSDDDLLAGEARLNLIRLARSEGHDDEVVTELETMLEATEPPLPKDVVLFELGVSYERLGRQDDALPIFERIVQEYPTSVYTSEAQQRVALLGGAAAPSPFPPGL